MNLIPSCSLLSLWLSELVLDFINFCSVYWIDAWKINTEDGKKNNRPEKDGYDDNTYHKP